MGSNRRNGRGRNPTSLGQIDLPTEGSDSARQVRLPGPA